MTIINLLPLLWEYKWFSVMNSKCLFSYYHPQRHYKYLCSDHYQYQILPFYATLLTIHTSRHQEVHSVAQQLSNSCSVNSTLETLPTPYVTHKAVFQAHCLFGPLIITKTSLDPSEGTVSLTYNTIKISLHVLNAEIVLEKYVP